MTRLPALLLAIGDSTDATGYARLAERVAAGFA
jgi:hypothetical protein